MSVSSDELLAFLRRLRAVKDYTPDPISRETIEAILEVGRWTGTGGNRQPTEVLVIRDPDTKRQLGEWGAAPAATAAVVLLLVTASDASTFDEGRVAERLALAAAARGLGSTIATLKNDGPAAAKRLLGIPAERRAVSLVAIGHPDVEARRARPKTAQARKPLVEYAHWDRYRAAHER
jgi:nitroreductase